MERIAVRKYELDECPATDTLFKLSETAYRLHLRVIGHPDEAEHIEKTLTPAQAEQWLSEAPEQIAMWGECKVLLFPRACTEIK